MKIPKEGFKSIYTEMRGKGLDISPLCFPFPIFSGNEMIYVDIFTANELKEQYKLHDNVDKSKIVEVKKVFRVELLPFEDDTFDFVLASHLIEHLISPSIAIQDWIRVTKKNGWIYIIVPDHRYCFDKDKKPQPLSHHQYEFTHKLLDHQKDDGLGHVHFWTAEGFKEYLEWLSSILKFQIEDFIITGQLHICALLKNIK